MTKGWQCDRNWRELGNGWLRPGLDNMQGIAVREAEAKERLGLLLDDLLNETRGGPPAKRLWPAYGEPQREEGSKP